MTKIYYSPFSMTYPPDEDFSHYLSQSLSNYSPCGNSTGINSDDDDEGNEDTRTKKEDDLIW